MASVQNTTIKTLVETRDQLQGSCEAFTKVLASANGHAWVTVAGIYVSVSDLRAVATAYNLLGRELKRRRVATTRVYVQQGNHCWCLALSRWVELCEAGAKGEGSDPASFDGFKLMGVPFEVEEYRQKALEQGPVPFYTPGRNFFYAEPREWTSAEFQAWLDEWRKEY
jgi:hypothetical protein